MKFALRYWQRFFVSGLKASAKIFIVLLAFDLFITVCAAFAMGEDGFLGVFLKFFVLPNIGFLVFYGLLCAIMVSEKYDVEKIRSEQGFSLEYYYAFRKKFIDGKPRNDMRYIEFAEIYQQMGDYKSAVDILNSLNISQSNVALRTCYLFVYMNTAVSMRDKELANDIWRSNEAFINSNINNPRYRACTNGMYLMMVQIDAVSERYERALQTCDNLLNSVHAGKWTEYSPAFMTYRVYLLCKLGREDELDAAYDRAYDCISRYSYIYDYERRSGFEELEKARKGELPV